MRIRGQHIFASPLILFYILLLATSAAAQTCPCDSCDATQKYNCGEWSAIASSNWPGTAPNQVVPVHMVQTKTGKILMWKGTTATTDRAHYWDPVTFAITDLPITAPAESTLFCAGHNVLADGRVVVIGGQCNNCGLASERPIGIRRTMLFDPDAGSLAFTQRRDMARGRWYPTGTMLPDGKVLGISGWKKGFKPGEGPDPAVLADTSEVYSIYTGSWTNLSTAPKNDISIYPFIQVDPSPNGTRVLYLGPGANAHDEVPPYGTLQPAQRLKNLDAGTPTWESNVGTYTVRGEGFARYNKDKVLKSGGTPSGGGSVTNQTDVLTINMSTGNITAALTDDMCAARSEHQLVVLADGTVLALAGTSVERGGGDLCSEGIYVTELWDPVTACWRQLAEMRPRSPKVPRMYHSTAVLLADASVLLAGGECKPECPGNPAGSISCRSGDFFKPPYLFKSNNSQIEDADRPAITGNIPLSIVYGGGLSFDRTTGTDATGISKVALVKPGSTTHSVNMAQQYIPLTFTDGATLTVNASEMPNTRMAPPGYYMLFLMNNASTNRPSKARFVVLWELIQSTVSGTLTINTDGTWTFRADWNTTAKVDQGDELVLTRQGDGFQVTVTGSPTDAAGLVHSLSVTRPCVPNEKWDWIVKSKRLKYTTGTTLSISTSTTKTFKITACLEP